jgi:hypothetical protein
MMTDMAHTLRRGPRAGIRILARLVVVRCRAVRPVGYLGCERSEHFASPDGSAFDERHAYELPERLRINQWAVAGEWTIGRENVVLDRAGGSIAYRFHARDAHLVLSSGAREPIPFRVLLDGEAPGPSHGVDVGEDGSGGAQGGPSVPARARARRGPRADARDHLPRARREAYVFTFG